MKRIYEIINYIVASFQGEPLKLGKVKLAKILWFADREFMYRYSRSLSGLEYLKLPNGSAPKKYDNILKDMQDKGVIHCFETFKYGLKQISFYSLKEPDLNVFTAQEVQILDSVIANLKNKNAKALSKLTHDELWKNTKNGEIMPIECVFWQDIIEPDDDDVKWAKRVLKAKNINVDSST